MRAIDADHLKQWILSRVFKTQLSVGDIIDQIYREDIIEPERKKGKWIYKNDLKQFFCSECGFPSLTYDDVYIYSMDLPNYCEDCGADMREDQDGKND